MPQPKITKSSAQANTLAATNRALLIAAWFIGLASSLVMAYFEYFAIVNDVDYSHSSLLGYPGYCLALVVTTILAMLHTRRVRGTVWTKGTIAIAAWTAISIILTLVVTNSTS